MIKVAIADDQTLLRETLVFILNKSTEIDVVGTAANGFEILNICEQNKPDVVLMDIQMPEMDGIEATKIIKEKYKNIKVLMLTTFENIENILESFVAGADGYIAKDIESKELILYIKCINQGIHVIHDSVHQLMVQQFIKVNNKKFSSDSLNREIELNETEIEIIRLVAAGKNNKEIAQIIGFADGTIKNKLTKIFEKTEISDRANLVVFAIENNII